MIRPLAQDDRDLVLSYLEEDHINNFHPIHALSVHGLENLYGAFWGTFSNGELQGVLFNEKNALTPFGCIVGRNHKALAELGKFAHELNISFLIGKRDLVLSAVRPLHGWIHQITIYDFYKIDPGQLKGRYDYPVRKATLEDVPALVEHYRNSEWSIYRQKETGDVEREIRRVITRETGFFFVELDGRIVSAARIVGETDRVGYLDEGSTLREFSGRGLNSCVWTACHEHLLRKGKVGVVRIMETNLAMQKIVGRTGGSFISKWAKIQMKRRLPLRERVLSNCMLAPIRRYFPVPATATVQREDLSRKP